MNEYSKAMKIVDEISKISAEQGKRSRVRSLNLERDFRLQKMKMANLMREAANLIDDDPAKAKYILTSLVEIIQSEMDLAD